MSGGYTPPDFADWDPSKPITADRALIPLGEQYEAVRRDITDPDSPVGAAIVDAVAAGGGGGGLIPDPDRPGTFIITNPGAISENPDRPGTFLIGGTP